MRRRMESRSVTMTHKSVTIVDYGMGNLLNVSRAFEHVGATIRISSDPRDVATADRLVLPGVGAFGDGMQEIDARSLRDAIIQFSGTGRPLLAICLGMQMLFDESEEFGPTPGLGLLQGRVVQIPSVGSNGAPHKIPHIGWNALIPHDATTSWQDGVLASVTEGQSVYFVHSYMAAPADSHCHLAYCNYNGVRIPAVVRMGNVTGCQFHPEKSGPVGLRIVGNFVAG